MNHYDFTQRAAVVTGGAQGIGYAVAERLLQGNARVALWDRDEAALADAKASLSHHGDVETVVVDLTQRDAVQAATDHTVARLGAIDILVHSAGIAGANAPLADYAPDEWARVIDVDLNAAFHVNQSVVKTMIARGYGRIVNIASIAGKEGNPNASAYSVAKAGVIALTKSLGKETATIIIVCSSLGAAACAIALPFTQSITTTLVLMTVGLVFIAATIGNAWALAADIAPSSMVASVSAIQNFGGYFGGAFSPVVAGFIVDRTGSYSLAFVIGGAIAGCAALFYWFMARRTVADGVMERSAG
ncbi:SDR family NAD(P)-dependent oxidoreductase [Paraburkholderia diazotrophica]|uniref:Major Facilitator Superfamily protein n=1 Tax=Paraburkholderia diazotrophica TaxID=667676 RepID=A0A1H7BUR0_9BURK|nr:SDR family NAD(P)-dependent oxidoreductase [Paraburkholderia diazotrophica]SEJ80744.1 Major Facilitator Superfamily protein [Paraburkholderia diazotrophica]